MQNNASVSSDESLNAENNKSDKKKTSATTLIRWILRIVFLLIILYEIVNKFTHPVEARIIGFIGVGIYLVLLRYSLVIAYRKNLKSFQFALIRNSILLGFLFAAWRWIFGYKCLSSEIGSVAFDFVLALFLLICILLSVIISIIVFIKREHRSMMDVYILVLIISGLCFLSLFPFIIKESQYIPEGLMGAVLNYSAMGFGMLFLFTVALTIPLIAFLYLRRKFTSVISFKFVVKRKLSYLAMATVGLGVFVLIIVTGVMGGFKAELRKRIRGSQSHLLVPISIPSSAQIKSNSEYSLPPFDEEMDKPDSTIYSALLDVEDTGKYEQFRKKVAEKYELEYKTLDQLSVEWDFEYQEKNDPLIYKALKKKVGFIEKANNAKTLETALRQKFDFEDSLTNPEMILKTRAILLGFTDEKDLRLIRHPQDLVALCRTDYLDKTMRRYREIILKLNDSEYRKELLEFIESRGNVVDSEWSGFMAPQSKVYEESKRILAGTARDEKIIEGASGRLRTMALIIKEQNREIDYCQIMAIDPSNDLLISDLGVYLQHALYYELNQHLVKNLYNTAMLVAREFSVTENEYYSPKIVRDDELTPVGRELFAEIMTTASLISKSPQEDRYPELPLKQQILLNDLRDNLTTIINRHRDKIVAEYMGKGLSFEDARAKARKESKEYVLINDMRGRIITGFYTFNKTLNSLISGKYSKYLCVDSTIELKGFNKSVIITPKPLKDKLLQIIKVGNKFISMQKNYTAKQIAFDDIKNSIINTTTDYLDKDWSNVKTALKNADENAVKTCFPLLSGIEGQISTDELDEIELHLINLLKLFEQTTLRANMSDDSTFWDIEDFSVISLDKIIDTDFSKVRHMLRFMTDGQSPFKGVMLKWDGSVKVQSSDVKDLLADDVITGIENKKIENFEDIRQIFKNLKFESKIKLQFIRKKGGKGTETLNAELVYNQELIIGVKQLIPFYRFEEDSERMYKIQKDSTQTHQADEIALPIPPVIIGDRMAQNYGTAGNVLSPSVQSRLHLATALAVSQEGSLEKRYEAREKSFYLSALFHSMFYEDDRRRVYMPLKQALTFLDGAQVEIFIGIKLADDKYVETEKYSNLIFAVLDHHMNLGEIGFRYNIVRSWEQEKATLIQAVDREEALLSVVLSFIIIYAGIMIVIIIYLMVKEKTKDIGILKALGGSPDGIQSIFLFNGFFIGFFGALFGLIAGLFVVFKSNWLEDIIERIWGIRIFPAEVYYLTYIPTKTDPSLWIIITIPTIILSFLFALYPAHKAALMDPVQALTYE